MLKLENRQRFWLNRNLMDDFPDILKMVSTQKFSNSEFRSQSQLKIKSFPFILLTNFFDID
jgi:hypothetical protein